MQPTKQAAVHLQNEGLHLPDLVRASFVFRGRTRVRRGCRLTRSPLTRSPRRLTRSPRSRLDKFRNGPLFFSSASLVMLRSLAKGPRLLLLFEHKAQMRAALIIQAIVLDRLQPRIEPDL